ncbi:MAG TPA: ubiquinone biosynthesis regulatory protein kinase UbiB [Dokdonella sp.]|uniref:ubiquinone biosynthesis regulatory protein kinase UbiB n=1 Tax=Dokdonella sp. TaxID=2291710 RepID=UPI0025B99795|nr:ubiquinone biosynthesis regulatory protein kinase UbiB [Dokdonella sp.]MBX3691361.1 ubiquinone biosynthesis regulatory protein kinase UbiB [Dokdonella sp.]MCW5567734.1 ubiquinone biosynthesis regulatory protein kinase UbiB [Dokdonella sp.]HNR90973.1 ubiquinone biosynthesis regulatory protein kinase UbiB [Dokdonella sp.]
MRLLPRLVRILAVTVCYRLDDVIDDARRVRVLRWMRRLVPAKAGVGELPRGRRLVLALTELGPIFVKFGQILSTRRDLLPADIADELTQLQDRVAPFPGARARAAIEAALAAPIDTRYAAFEEEPLASASIAQVHAARLPDGREVVVKVLRPDIRMRIARDVDLLRALGELAARTHPNADKIRPLDVVAEIESTLFNELDLQREGANASLLRRNFLGSADLYVPEVVWSHTNAGVLTLERVHGIPVDDLAALDAAGIDRVKLAEKGVRLFYTQVFRDNFFHADAHAGNIWVDPTRRDDPRFIALDFGIMGSLPEQDLYWLAENFLALFGRDYRRIAELHLRAGWMPGHVRGDELEAAVRAVCEPYFTRPLSEISLAEVVVKLFQTARRYELTLQPQLILLQKTLLNIEGVGRLLHPQIDIWAVARPVLERIWWQRRGPKAVLKSLRRRLPEWLALAPEFPQRVYDFLDQQTRGESRFHIRSAELEQLATRSRIGQRIAVLLTFAASSALGAVALQLFDTQGARPGGVSVWALGAALAAAAAFVGAWRAR